MSLNARRFIKPEAPPCGRVFRSEQCVEYFVNHVSLFAGMGGFVLGMERAGIATMLCNDFEEACVRTLVANWGEGRVDSRSIDDTALWQRAGELGAVDVVSGGFPCQSFSIAGAQQGFDDLERGSKFFDMMSFVDALIEPPKVLFLENVPNLKTYNGGQWLAEILTALKKRGFWISQKQCLLLNTQTVVGSPQSRERLFLIAYHQAYFKKNYFQMPGPRKPAANEDLWGLLNISQKEEDRLYLPPENKHYRMLEAAMSKDGVDRLYQVRRGSVRANPHGVCPTLTANMGGGGHNVPFVKDDYGIRRLSVAECLALQGFPSDYKFADGLSDTAKLKMIGNSVNPKLIEAITEKIVEDLNVI